MWHAADAEAPPVPALFAPAAQTSASLTDAVANPSPRSLDWPQVPGCLNKYSSSLQQCPQRLTNSVPYSLSFCTRCA